MPAIGSCQLPKKEEEEVEDEKPSNLTLLSASLIQDSTTTCHALVDNHACFQLIDRLI